jgi:hypothetical protein
MSYAITRILRLSLLRLDRRSTNGAGIGQSYLSPIQPTLYPLLLATVSAELGPRKHPLLKKAAWLDILVPSLLCVLCESATGSVRC